jgi:hypothetical protein
MEERSTYIMVTIFSAAFAQLDSCTITYSDFDATSLMRILNYQDILTLIVFT